MKFTTILLLANAACAIAFAPPRPHSSTKQIQFQENRFQQQQIQKQQSSSSALSLFPDPSALGSSTMLTADVIEGLVSTVGSLALLGSVGFGVYSGTKSDWEFQYKPGNDEAMQKYGSNADLALIEVSPDEVAEDMVKAETTPAQKSFFGKGEAKAEPKKAAPKKAELAVPVVTAQPGKASKTSDKVLQATEVAKSEVQKKGVQKTKEKMSSKSSAATPPSAEEELKEGKPEEVAEVKKDKGTKRKLVKGAGLIVAAGAVALARNVVKAWLGRGML